MANHTYPCWLVCLLIFTGVVNGLEITSTPYYMTTATGGDFLQNSFTLYNPNNASASVTIAVTGDLTSSLILGTNSLTMPSNSSSNINYFINVPNLDEVFTSTIIITTGSDTINYPITLVVTKNETEEEEEDSIEGKLIEAVVTEYNKYIIKGDELALTPRIYNPNDFAVTILAVESGGATADFFRPEWEVKSSIQPQDMMSLPVTIVTEKVKPGVYQPYIEVVAIKDGIRKIATINFKINVVKSEEPGEDEPTGEDEIKISIPTSVEKGERFTIKVDNLLEDDGVRVGLSPFNALLISSEQTDTEWQAIYKILKDGEYTVNVEVYRNGALAAGNTTTIKTAGATPTGQACTLSPNYNPTTPPYRGVITLTAITIKETGQDVTDRTTVYLDGTLWIRNSELTLESKESHLIEIYPTEDLSDCPSKTYEIITVKPTMQLQVNPSPNIEVGGTITIIAYDSESKESISANVLVSGIPYTTGTPILMSNQGNYEVVISREGYQDANVAINVLPVLASNTPFIELTQG